MISITGITSADCQGEVLGFINKHSIGNTIVEYRSDKFVWGEQSAWFKDMLMFSFIVESLTDKQLSWFKERVQTGYNSLYIDSDIP